MSKEDRNAAASGDAGKNKWDLPAFSSIGPYRVTRRVGSGGMAEVLEVVDPLWGRPRALKLLKRPDEPSLRFHKEHRLLSTIHHPGVVRLLRHAGPPGVPPYLTMELLVGQTVQGYIRSVGIPGSPRRIAEVLRILRELAIILDYLHSHLLLHLDIKASNVLILADGGVKLLDLGTGIALEPGHTSGFRGGGELSGTLVYASPEQLRGGALDARSDLYSLGVLSYRMLTGRQPFKGLNSRDVARKQLEWYPPGPSEVVDAIPGSVSALVMQLLAKNPASRPASAAVLLDRLHNLERAGLEPASRPAFVPPNIPTIGRRKVLMELETFLLKASSGSLCLLRGPPGSGISDLLNRLANKARLMGFGVLSSTAHPTQVALLTRKLLRAGAAPLEDPEETTEPLYRGGAHAAGSPTSAEGRTAGGSEACRAEVPDLEPGNGPLLLVLHQVPIPEERDVAFLLRLRDAARMVPFRVLVLLGHEGPYPLGVDPWNVIPNLFCLEPEPLNRAEVRHTLTLLLGGKSPPPGLSDRLHADCAGLPEHLLIQARSMLKAGLLESRTMGIPGLAPERRAWIDLSRGQQCRPRTVRESWLMRLAALDAPHREMLEPLALAACPLPLSLLEAAWEGSASGFRRVLGELSAQGILCRHSSTPVALLGLCSAMMGDLVRDRMGSRRRRELAGRLLCLTWPRTTTLGRLRILMEAGQYRLAALEAPAWYPVALADGSFEEVRACLGSLLDRQKKGLRLTGLEQVELVLGYAAALVVLEPEESERAFKAALRYSKSSSGLRGKVLLYHGEALSRRGEVTGAAGGLEAAPDLLRQAGHLGLASRAASELGWVALSTGDAVRGQGWMETGLALALAQGGQGDGVRGGSGSSNLRDHQQGAGELVARRGERLCGVAMARASRAALLFHQGAISQAESELRQVSMVLLDWAGHFHLSRTVALLSRVLCLQARFSEAGLELARISRLLGDSQDRLAVANIELAAASLELELLRLGGAMERLEQAEDLVLPGETEYSCRIAQLRARVHLAAGEDDRALTSLKRALPVASSSGLKVLESEMRATLGLTYGRLHRPEHSRALIRRAKSELRAAGNQPGLAWACRCEALSMPAEGQAARAFDCIAPWLDTEPAVLPSLWRLEASRLDAEARNQRARLDELRGEARRLLGLVHQRASIEDGYALSVHPWAELLD